MKTTRKISAAVLVTAAAALMVTQAVGQQGAQREISVKALPASVVKTVPAAGDTEVDAAKTKEIRVTFSKKMTDGTWSAAQISSDSFPKVTGELHYEKDMKTWVLPAELEPGRTYVIWINQADRFLGFKDAEGMPSVPYLLVFETAK